MANSLENQGKEAPSRKQHFVIIITVLAALAGIIIGLYVCFKLNVGLVTIIKDVSSAKYNRTKTFEKKPLKFNKADNVLPNARRLRREIEEQKARSRRSLRDVRDLEGLRRIRRHLPEDLMHNYFLLQHEIAEQNRKHKNLKQVAKHFFESVTDHFKEEHPKEFNEELKGIDTAGAAFPQSKFETGTSTIGLKQPNEVLPTTQSTKVISTTESTPAQTSPNELQLSPEPEPVTISTTTIISSSKASSFSKILQPSTPVILEPPPIIPDSQIKASTSIQQNILAQQLSSELETSKLSTQTAPNISPTPLLILTPSSSSVTPSLYTPSLEGVSKSIHASYPSSVATDSVATTTEVKSSASVLPSIQSTVVLHPSSTTVHQSISPILESSHSVEMTETKSSQSESPVETKSCWSLEMTSKLTSEMTSKMVPPLSSASSSFHKPVIATSFNELAPSVTSSLSSVKESIIINSQNTASFSLSEVASSILTLKSSSESNQASFSVSDVAKSMSTTPSVLSTKLPVIMPTSPIIIEIIAHTPLVVTENEILNESVTTSTSAVVNQTAIKNNNNSASTEIILTNQPPFEATSPNHTSTSETTDSSTAVTEAPVTNYTSAWHAISTTITPSTTQVGVSHATGHEETNILERFLKLFKTDSAQENGLKDLLISLLSKRAQTTKSTTIPGGNLECENRQTKWNRASIIGTERFLESQHVDCKSGEVLQKFRLVSDQDAVFPQYRYEFVCCRLLL